MPINRYSDTSPTFFEPEESIVLARYIDITKFLSLLKDRKMFFCRLDKLEDRFEGTLPQLSQKHMIEWYTHLRDVENFFTVTMSNSDIEKKVKESIEFREKLKSLNCINCWNEFEDESYALWKVYSNLNQGIMIKSSFKRIIKAFEKSDEEIYCSKVKYIDYETERIGTSNTMTPIVHKHKAYSYENEIRLIHEVKNESWKYDWENAEYENGVKISVNLEELISEIIISPFASDWFKELISDILDKYNLKCDIKFSKLK